MFFFCGLAVVGTMKEKKRAAEEARWATAHFPSFESRYNVLYRDRLGTQLGWAQPGGHDTARTRPRHGRACATILLACARANDVRAPMAWLLEIVS